MKASPQKIVRWENGAAPLKTTDELAEEEPLEIRVDNHRVSVTMRTPGHDDELAAGFLLGEGLISRREEVIKIAPHPRNRDQNIINAFLAPGAPLDLGRLARNFFVS